MMAALLGSALKCLPERGGLCPHARMWGRLVLSGRQAQAECDEKSAAYLANGNNGNNYYHNEEKA